MLTPLSTTLQSHVTSLVGPTYHTTSFLYSHLWWLNLLTDEACVPSMVDYFVWDAQMKRGVEKIPTKAILDGLKRSMSRGNSLSGELDLSSVLGDTRSYLYSLVLG